MYHEIYPHKLDITYLVNQTSTSDDLVIQANDKNEVRVIEEGEDMRLPTVGEIKDEGLEINSERFLFALDDKKVFWIQGDIKEKTGITYKSSRDLRYIKPQHLSYAASVASSLIGWYKNNKFCSRCGSPTRHSDTERALVCTDENCKFTKYPTISPSVIVLIRNGNKALLTKYALAHSSYNRYALVAGYVETSETPEETVMREVKEEVGLKVKNIHYYKSQPWPLSGALLLGFYCDLDGSDEVTLDTNELSVGDWVSREDMPDRSDDVSLTSELMEQFRTGKL
ncbi:MAG: NAD(+) diphosphatase [Clostridia bacterium]|nr:NAD(+) diphosphatase [Clostridia bacterium]